jgi:hypothetical protein
MLLGSFKPHARASSGTVEVWSWRTERRSAAICSWRFGERWPAR